MYIQKVINLFKYGYYNYPYLICFFFKSKLNKSSQVDLRHVCDERDHPICRVISLYTLFPGVYIQYHSVFIVI